MKKSLLFIGLIMVMLSSCVTQRRCNEKFPPIETYTSKDSTYVKDSIVYQQVEVPVYIKGDTVLKNDTVYRDWFTGLINSKPVYAETTFAKAKAQVTNGKLSLELIQRDSLFNVKSDSLIKVAYYWKTRLIQERTTAVINKKYIPPFYKITSFMGLFLLTVLVVYFIFRFRNKFSIR